METLLAQFLSEVKTDGGPKGKALRDHLFIHCSRIQIILCRANVVDPGDLGQAMRGKEATVSKGEVQPAQETSKIQGKREQHRCDTHMTLQRGGESGKWEGQVN